MLVEPTATHELHFHAQDGVWFYFMTKKGQRTSAEKGGAGEIFRGYRVAIAADRKPGDIFTKNTLPAGEKICVKFSTLANQQTQAGTSAEQTAEFLALQVAGLNPRIIPGSKILLMDEAPGTDLAQFLATHPELDREIKNNIDKIAE